MEKHFNTNPTAVDSDGSGLADGKKSFRQQFSNATLGITVDVDGNGMLQKTLKIEKALHPYVPLTKLSGVVGDFYTVNTTSSFKEATLCFSYDESRLNGSKESSLKLFYFDKDKKVPVEAENQKLDTKTNTIEASTDRLGTWFIADPSDWSKQTKQKQDKKTSTAEVAADQQAVSFTAEGLDSDIQTGSTDDQYMLLSLEESYNVGDVVNVRAQVHNSGNANIGSGTNVLVRFYDGNPANNILIGSTTITSGISQGSSQTSVIQYTITHLPADIYVSVDPLNGITEQSETNNKAYKVMSSDPQTQDSDGDGLTDVVETGGMYVGYPYGYIYTDPYDEDMDDDGLLDSQEVIHHSDTGTYELISYPNNKDSDGDGLWDDEEYDFGTNSFIVDSDYDSIWDSIDPNPLVYDQPEAEPSIFDIVGKISKGIVFGDTGYEGGVFNWLVV